MDRIKRALLELVEQHLARVDLHAWYASEVVAQAADGSLDLRLIGTSAVAKRFGAGWSRVPIRYGVPGVRAAVKVGARALLGFEGGDAQAPIAIVTDGGSLDSITISAESQVTVLAPKIVAAAAESKAIPTARQGDPVVVGSIKQAAIFVPFGTVPTPGAPPVPLTTNTPYGVFWYDPTKPLPPLPQLIGFVMNGNPKVKT